MATSIAPTLALGRYPTPVERATDLPGVAAEIWVKRDDLTHAVYGGNKVRKLERVLAEARARGYSRLATIGAAGSHHVLATTYFGQRAGFAIEAALFPQVRTDHAADVLRADVGLGLRAFPTTSPAAAAMTLASRALGGAGAVAPGGSSVAGAMGYVDAVRELAQQMRESRLPEPDVCVVALGSGGTAAGLAAGFAAERLRTRVVGVCVLAPTWVAAEAARVLAQACARRLRLHRSLLRGRLAVDARFVGRGYGWPTLAGQAASDIARAHAGLDLDPTYTAKAFACALDLARTRPEQRILYWHTLSSAPMAPLLERAPPEKALPPTLQRLLLAPPGHCP